MIITALRRKSSNVIVEFDDGTFLSLDYRTVLDNGLRKADHLEEENIEKLAEESNFLKARDSAFRFLSRRLHSKSELRTKLLKKKYSKGLIEKVLGNLNEKGFLNDEEFAKAFISERMKTKKVGINRLTSDLAKRGISRKEAEKHIYNLDQDEYLENAVSVASKKYEQLKRKETDKRKLASKLFSFLISKGYESDLVRNVISKIKIEIEE